MSPLGFKSFALIWLACSGALVLAALYLALLPWLPEREAPPYALRLVGALPAQSARCTVEVLEPGAAAPLRKMVPCAGTQAAAAQGNGATDAYRPTRRRLAAALHGVLMLVLAGALSGLLHWGLRTLFLRPGAAHWVRHAA